MKSKSGVRLYIAMLLCTAAVSAVAFFLCRVTEAFKSFVSHFVLTGAFFAVFFLLLAVAVVVCECIFNGFPENDLRGKMKNPRIRKSFALFFAAALVGSFLLGGVFQWLYELEPSKKQVRQSEASAYAFVIDNSYSMEVNDEDNMRFDALTEICATIPSDKPIAVYLFGDEAVCVRPFIPQDDLPVEPEDTWKEEMGGTMMGSALKMLFADVDTARDAGDLSGTVRVIALTDGDSFDLNISDRKPFNETVDGALDSDCEIFSIGFGDPDRNTLEELSWSTNGEYYDAGDAYNIASSMTAAVKAKSHSRGRMLMGLRTGKTAYSFWYALMRVVFVALLGFGVSFASAMMLDEKDIIRVACIECAVKSFAAALLLELLMQSFMSGKIVQLVVCLLIGTLVLMRSVSRLMATSFTPDLSTYTGASFNAPSVQSGSAQRDPKDLSVKM